jgi:hypothetical protein
MDIPHNCQRQALHPRLGYDVVLRRTGSQLAEALCRMLVLSIDRIKVKNWRFRQERLRVASVSSMCSRDRSGWLERSMILG